MNKTINYDMADVVERMASTGCHKHCVSSALPDDPVVAMAYVPFQLDRTAYTPEQALQNGTLFTVLNKPFCGRSVLND